MENFTQKNGVMTDRSCYMRAIVLLVIMLANFGLYAQQEFLVRQVDTVRGDILMVGNNIHGLTNNPPNSPYNTLGTSNGGTGFDTAYIDVDGDNSTFSSSSADIINPNPGCAEIVYAGLYWSANYYLARENPASTSYSNYTIIFNDLNVDPIEVPRSNFNNDISTDDFVIGNMVVAQPQNGCNALTNAADIAGNIALIRRSGACNFTQQVLNAQAAGAIGVLIVNNGGTPFEMTGTAASQITIPSAMIGNNDIVGWDAIDLVNNFGNRNITMGQGNLSGVRLTINNSAIAGVFDAKGSEFGNDNSDIRLSPASSNLEVAQPENGCGITNPGALAGKIAVIREGGPCSIRNKIIEAQDALAIGVVIVGNTGTAPSLTGGGGTAINIPSLSIGNDDINGGDLILLLGGETNVVNATINTSGNEELNGLPTTDPRFNGTANYRDILFGFGPAGSVNYVPVQPQAGTQVVNGTTTHPGIIYDGYAGTASNLGTTGSDNIPYTCYANVTDIVQANGFGTYTVGNMKATVGETSGVSGAAGGWTLVVFYEDPTPSATNVVRFLTTFDGFREIQGGGGATSADLNITGFRTLPAPNPVNVRFGAAALEGDSGIQGDNLSIDNDFDDSTEAIELFNTINPEDNFFNSSISVDGAYYPNRNPASQNTLGYDSDIFALPNASRNLIGNDQTTAEFILETDGDTYQAFMTAFSVENIVPKIRNIKEVYDPSDLTTPINNNPVNLGDALVYRLNLKNVGNEDLATTPVPIPAVINDILPDNVDLISIDGIDVAVQPSGNLNSIPAISYTTSGVGSGGTQTITFTIPPDLLERTDAEFSIDFLVRLVATCEDLRDACSNEINNVAVTTYTGQDSGIEVIDDPSSSEVLACGDTDGRATNFLATVPPCELDTPFCGGDLRLTAGGDYDIYEWSGPGGFTATTNVPFVDIPNAIGGVYTVVKIDNTPDADGNLCMTLTEQFNVTDFSATPHPLQDNAAAEDNVEYFEDCSVPLVKINLCGSQTYLVDTEFDPGNLVSITWQELSNTACFDRDDNCPAVTGGCADNANWTDVATAPLTTSLSFADAGEYRFIVEFQGGCTEVFYFDINKNDYQPEVDIVNMECNNDGSVTVNNIASPTLRFLIRLQSDPAPTLPGDLGLFTNDTGMFTIPFQTNPYIFTVYAVDTAFPNCIFSVNGTVNSSTPTFTVTTTDPTCPDDTNTNGFGTANIVVAGGLPDYEYRITGGPNNIDITSGSGDASNGNFDFINLEPGAYTISVTSNNPAPNCVYSENITINPAADFVAEVVLVSEETCDSGAIVQINVLSGSGGPYEYADSSGVFTSNNQFEIPAPADPTATYTFSVSDTSSTPFACIINADITGIQPYVPFTIDSVTPNSADCPGDPGTIDVAVSSAAAAPGRTFTYQLWNCANDPDCNDAALRDTSLWILVQEIGPTINENITFANVADGNSYAVSVLHNNVNDPTGPAICRQDDTIYAIQANTSVSATVTITRELSCITGQESAQVTINGFTGGSGTYEWSTAVSGPYTPVTLPDTVIDLAVDGNYTIFVRDLSATDCPFSEDITIDPLATVDDLNFTENSTDCSAQTVEITVSALPVGPTYTYSAVPAPISGDATTGVFVLNRNVTYTFTAVRGDNQCSYDEDYFAPLLSEIDITSAVEASPIVCNGDANGSLSFTVTNTTDFDWEVLDATSATVGSGSESGTDPTTVTVGSLGDGTYTINVTDTSITSTSACTDTTTVTLTEPVELTFDTDATESDCGADTGTITVSNVVGGRGNYQYRLVSSGGIVIVDYPNTNTTFTGLAPDTYTIFVRDGNDPAIACEVTATETVGLFASPTIALATGGDQCYDGTDQATQWITITPGVNPPLGPFEYILDRGTGPETPVAVTFLGAPAPANTFEIDNLTPGNYTVFVRNTNTQCITTTVNFTINPELTITTNLDKDIDCNGDAVISFTASDGSGTYTQYDLYVQGTPPVLSQSNITSVHTIGSPGTYLVQVTDDIGCTAFSNPVTVTAYEALAATATETNPECPTDGGSIEVNVTAGEGPFTYVLDGTTTIGPTGDTTVTFNNVAVGIHNIEITDGSGGSPACTLDLTNIEIIAPTAISTTASETQEYRCDAAGSSTTPQLGEITVVVPTTGTPPYEYSIDGVNWQLSNVFTGLTDGIYTIQVRDAVTTSCPVTLAPVTIDPLVQVTDLSFNDAQVQCPALTSSVVVSATLDGTSAVEYRIVAPVAEATAFSANDTYTLNSGTTYTFEARTTVDGCIYSENFTVPVVDPIAVTATLVSEPSCNGFTDGELSFTVSGIDFTGTTYAYQITEAGAAIAPINGTGQTVATISTGGVLPAGVYTILVTDETTLCTATDTVTLTDPVVLGATAAVTTPLTCVQDAVITVTVTGGNGGEQYTLLDSGAVVVAGPQSSNIFTVSAADTYTINITDAENCPTSTTVTVDPPRDLDATLGASDFCLDDGAVSFVVNIDAINFGTPNYSYNVTRSGVVVIPDTPIGAATNFTTTPALTQPGDYVITITDSNGCQEVINVPTVEPAVELVATQVRDITCDLVTGAQIDAEFSFAVNGGYTPYNIDVIFNSGAPVNHVTGGTTPFPNYLATLGAGTYEFVVTDARNCTFTTAPFEVTAPVAPTITAPQVDVDCFGDLGTAVITVTGTETPYEIDFQNTTTFVTITGTQISFPNLAEGTYPFTVRSSRGCTYTGSVTIDAPDDILEVFRDEEPVTCGGSVDITELGAIDLEIAGGTGPYTYTLVEASNLFVRPLVPAATAATTPNPTTIASTVVRFEGLNFGQYYIFVEDVNGCVSNPDPIGPFNIFSPPNDLIQSVTISATCPGGVTFDIDVQGGSGINPPLDPPPGFDIRIVGEPAPNGVFQPLNDDPLNATIVDANTPVRIHQYTNLEFNRTYILEVRDNETGCLYQELVPPVDPPSEPDILNLMVSDVNCNVTPAVNDGEITFDISGYDPSVTQVSWEVFDQITNLTLGAAFSGVSAVVSPAAVPVTISNFPPGQYYVVVREDDGTLCPTREDFVINIPDPLDSVATNQTPANSCGTNAQVIMQTTGGTQFAIPPTADGYQYALIADDGFGSPVTTPAVLADFPLLSNVIDLGNVNNEVQHIFVIDDNGCIFGPVTVTTVLNPLPTVLASFIDDCAYDSSNVIDVDGTGLGTLLYQLDGGTAVVGSIDNNNHQFTVSTPGTYTITVSDESGCSVNQNVTVYGELVISAAFTTAPDCNTATGIITTTIDSGVVQGTLTYVLQDGLGTPTGNTTGDATGVYTGVAPGNYIVVATDDGRGVAPFCSFSAPVSIDAPTEPVLLTDTSSVTCNGDTDGTITAQLTAASIDVDPAVIYEYRIIAGPTAPLPTPYQTSPIFTGLDNGTYTVEVRATKPNGALNVICLDTEDYIINDPTDPTVTITNTAYSCNPGTTEVFPVITLDNFTGGSGTPYRIEYTDPSGNTVGPVDPATLDTDAVTAGIQIIATEAGNYTFTVYDSNNCDFTLPVYNIPAFPIMTDAVVNLVTPINCATNTEEVTVTVTGGTGPYDFVEINGAVPSQLAVPSTGASTTSASFFLPGVGNYIFRVTDQATGCTIDTVPYEIMPYDTIEANIAVVTPNIECFGDATGNIELTVTGHTGPYNYTVTNTTTGTVTGPIGADTTVQNPITIGGLEAGSIQVSITDPASSCDDDSNIVVIGQPTEVLLSLVSNTNANCNTDARVVVEANGGTSPYTFTATDVPFGGGFTATNSTGEFLLPAAATTGTTYRISVVDDNNCDSNPVSIDVLVERTDDPVLNPLTVDDVCTHDGSYIITATGTSSVAAPPGTGALEFQLDGGTIVAANNGLTSHQFTVSTPGTYQVTAYDENGCATNTESITILPEIIASADFTADPSCRDVNGTITVTLTGGSDFSVNPGNFTFTLRDEATNAIVAGPQVGNNIFTPIAAGDYIVEITDVNIPAITAPCTITIDVPELPVPVDPIITAAGDAVSCIGATDGTVTVTLTNPIADDAPYTYQLFVDTGGGVPGAQIGVDQIENPIFTGLATGNYVAVVTSDRSCAGQDTVNVPNATQVTAVTAQSAYSCAADNSEVFPVITVTIENGTPPYTVEYDTPSGNTITAPDVVDVNGNPADGVQYEILADEEGNYIITVTDFNGCNTVPVTVTETIAPFPIMTNPAVNVTTDITCPVDEVVEVSVQGGSGDFLFEVIDGPAGATLPAAQDEPAGTNISTFTLPRELGIYTFLITDQGTNCTITVTHELDQFDFIAVAATQQTPESCFGDADGAIAISITGYTGTYNFEILDEMGNSLVPPIVGTGDTTTDPDPYILPVNIPQGTYIVQVEETTDPLCTELSNVVTVDGPDQPLMAFVSGINTVESCDPGNDGSIQASVTGAQGTTVTYELFLTSDATFTTVLQSNQTGLFENLPAEDYTVRATDGNGCDNTARIVIDAANLITLDPLAKTDITCFGDANGTITASASGGQGSGTYLYILTRPNGSVDGATSNPVFENLGPGIYSVIATDNLGCDTAPQSIEILEPSELTVNFMIDRNVTCPDPTMDVTVSGTSDVGIVEYIIVNVTDQLNPIETSNGNNPVFLNIPEGEYQFYVRDVNGCQSPFSGGLTVIPIPDITFELDLTSAFINCTDGNNAVVDILNVTGGTGDYTFTLTGTLDAGGDYGGSPAGISQATSEFRDLPAGTYTYTITTDRACNASRNFTVTNPPLFTPEFIPTSVSCFGEDDGMITINASGGTPPYAFAIGEGGTFGEFLNDESDGVPNQHIFENLIGGVTYTVLAQDSLGCQEIMDFTIDEPAQLMVEIDGAITPETCAGDMDGAVTITISGGTPPYFTNITNNDGDFVQDLFTYNMLPGGQTIIYIRDDNNCRTEITVDVPPGVVLGGDLNQRLECPVWDYSTPENPVMTQGPTYFVNFELNPGSVTVDIEYMLIGINGTADPTPSINTTGEFEVLPGEYEGSMMHVGGCVEVIGTITVEEYIPLTTPVAQMTNNPQDPNEYEIIVTGGSGNPDNYTYFIAILPDGFTVDQLQDSDFRELDSNLFSIDETADYVLRVIDEAGCEVLGIQELIYINIIIPNYFTPDGDGTDDLWYPDQISGDPSDPFFFDDMEVRIFDRYGRMLEEFVGDQEGWDGIYQGKELPSGDYWYTIILNDIDNRTFTGHFTLYR